MPPPAPQDRPSAAFPIVSVVGYKNSGKTTFVVSLVQALKRRGARVATAKHGHHRFEIDHAGTDSHRHKHEGGAEAVLLLSDRKLALVSDLPEPPDPEEAIRRHFAHLDLDLVIVEGLKQGPFPKIEIHREAASAQPVYATAPDTSSWILVVSDRPLPDAPAEVIPLAGDGAHVERTADLLLTRYPIAP